MQGYLYNQKVTMNDSFNIFGTISAFVLGGGLYKLWQVFKENKEFDVKTFGGRFDDMVKRVDTLQNKYEDVLKAHYTLVGEHKALQTTVEQNNNKITGLEKENFTLKSEINEKNVKIDQLQKQVNIIDPAIPTEYNRRKTDMPEEEPTSPQLIPAP